MTRPATAVAFEAVYQRITAGATACSGRGYPFGAPAGTARPYAVYFQSGGGNLPSARGRQQAELVLTVKAVANTLAAALEAAGELKAILHDQGMRESVTPLAGGDDWDILTSTAEAPDLALRELVDGVPVFHQGFHLRLRMEERT